MKEGLLSERQRLWVSPYRGHWRNTDLGNQMARQILRRNGWLVQKGESVLNPVDEEIPDVERPYMEEELAREAMAETVSDDESESALAPENLLAHIDRILSSLPEVSFDKLPASAGPGLSTRGSPKEVLGVIRALADSLPASKLRLVVTMGPAGYHVEIDAACRESGGLGSQAAEPGCT